jgi:hypothetical protein
MDVPDAMHPAEEVAKKEDVPTLITLPEELVRTILVGAGDIGTAAVAQTCRVLCAVAKDEDLWEDLVCLAWPHLVEAARKVKRWDTCPPVDGWRRMHHRRVTEAGPAWRRLCPLHDHILLHAHEDPTAEWLGEHGAMLLRVDAVVRQLGVRSERSPAHLRWRLCLAAAHGDDRLARAAAASADECCRELDEWYDQLQAGSTGCERGWPLLHRAFGGLSALATSLRYVAAGSENAHALALAVERVCELVRSLQSEGCDLSIIPAPRRPAHAAWPDHWWWRCPEPTFVSGGCPLIVPI